MRSGMRRCLRGMRLRVPRRARRSLRLSASGLRRSGRCWPRPRRSRRRRRVGRAQLWGRESRQLGDHLRLDHRPGRTRAVHRVAIPWRRWQRLAVPRGARRLLRRTERERAGATGGQRDAASGLEERGGMPQAIVDYSVVDVLCLLDMKVLNSKTQEEHLN